MTKKFFQEEIKKITAQVIKNYQPEKIILFGSAARGDLDKDSNAEVLLSIGGDPHRKRNN